MTRAALITEDGRELEATPAGQVATVDEPCPGCGKHDVRGHDCHIGGHDYYSAHATCAQCGLHRGELRAYVGTIFGLAEDRNLFENGRCRVY